MSSSSGKSNKWWIGPLLGVMIAGLGLAASWGFVKAEVTHLKEADTRIEAKADINTNTITEIRIEQGKVMTLLEQIAEDIKEIKNDLKNE